jgi:hypothetical protein
VGKPRISRIIGTLFGIATLTSLAMGLMAWLSLPKWTKVEAGLSAFQFSAPSSSEQALPRSTPSSGRMPLRSPTSRTLPRVDRSHPKTTILDYLIRRFASGSGGGVGGPPIRVCENLIDTPAVFPVDAGSYEQALLQIAQGDGDHENPYIESSLAPIAAALRLPAVGKFADAIERAKTSADPRLAEGDDFRSLTSLAASEVVANRAALSSQAQHAYHLFVLSRATLLVPAIGTNSSAQAFCAHEQSLATSRAPETSAQMDAEKATLLRLLALAKITPEQVGFDANLANNVSVTISARGLTINVPWMMKQFGEAFDLENTAQPAP